MQKRHEQPTPTILDATLRIPVPNTVMEPLLKDTLARTEPRAQPKHPKQDKPGTGRLVHAIAKRKLAKHVFYPEEAVAAGLEGEVRLVLTLDGNGVVKDVQVADSSGHAILDQAAIRAAYAMGSLPGVNQREIILPVTFRLQP